MHGFDFFSIGDRVLVGIFQSANTTATVTHGPITVGGVTANLAVAGIRGPTYAYKYTMFSARVTSGTSGTVVCTSDGTQFEGILFGMWALYGCDSANAITSNTANGATGGANANTTLNLDPGSITIGWHAYKDIPNTDPTQLYGIKQGGYNQQFEYGTGAEDVGYPFIYEAGADPETAHKFWSSGNNSQYCQLVASFR